MNPRDGRRSPCSVADAVCCIALRERSVDGNHAAAVQLLSRVDSNLTRDRVLGT